MSPEKDCTKLHDIRRVAPRDCRQQIRPRPLLLVHLAIAGAGQDLIPDFLELARAQVCGRIVADVSYRGGPGILRILRGAPLRARVDMRYICRALWVQIVETATRDGTANLKSPAHQTISNQYAARGGLGRRAPRHRAVE